ncbi:unc-119 lipid binding chaperone [Brevipalpus obovatus]|uniref:unc-119 lipid binding chaperone n=1 Tax=Brevipalpus obovatus TaxID=246614 RepID=UPI003D9EF7D4
MSLMASSSSSSNTSTKNRHISVKKTKKDAAHQSDQQQIEISTEEQLRLKKIIRPEDVIKLNKMTDGYLCFPEANIYDIEFTKFRVRDMEKGTVLFEIVKPPNTDTFSSSNVDSSGNGSKNAEIMEMEDQLTTKSGTKNDANVERFIRYRFSPQFLKLKTVGATVEFTVGDQPVTSFRMIERHFFRDKLLKTFDFDFGFCIPNSINTCEHIYEFPSLSSDMCDEMIKNPYETKSDSFYFVDNRLIMHNKAEYAYKN